LSFILQGMDWEFATLVEDQWLLLRCFLPVDLDAHAREHGAMRRKRGKIEDANQLLKVLLMHIAGGLSLEQTVTRASVKGLAKLNAMALHKRLCSSRQWLEALTGHLLKGVAPLMQSNKDYCGLGRRVRILDASTIQEPGATGSNWRLHYSLRLPELCCDFFEITDVKGGESVGRLPLDRGDLVMLDRGYNDRKAIAGVIDAGADVILRYNSGSFPLIDSKGAPFDLLPHLRPLEVGQIGEWKAYFQVGSRHLSVRVCALRKSQQAAQLAERKILLKASRNGVRVRNSTLELTNFIVVLTTVPAEELSSFSVLEFYRARWQVELAFKRLKSLLNLGQLPKTKEQSSLAWMQGKILTALFIERILCEAQLFSPWGYPLSPTQPLDSL
jgi:hypothetical protein